MRIRPVVVLSIALSVGVVAIPVSAAPNPVSAQIMNFSFQPDPITVEVGGSVTWTNQDATTHTVTFDSIPVDSGDLDMGATFKAPFPTVGQFTYHCAIHPFMTGTVNVTPAQAPPPPLTPRVWFPIVLR